MKGLKENRWFALAITAFGLFIILIDATVVNVSIPSIIKDLNASLSDVEWVISGYSLSFAAFLILFGRLGDIYGRRLLFILGLIVFTIASYFSGEAQSASTLIFARLFQGVGAAMISPSTLSIISSTFKGRERAIAFGIWGGVAGLATAVGPILGGFLTTNYSWRWVFRINIPIGIVAVILSLFFLNESKSHASKKIDFSGLILSTVGFFLLTFALIEGQTYGWFKPNLSNIFKIGNWQWTDPNISIIPNIIVLSCITLSLFVLIEYRKTLKNDSPAVNIDLFKSRAFKFGLIATAVISLGQFSSLFTLPIYLQSVKGYTALQTGYAFLPLAIAAFIAAPLSGRIVNKIGSKWIIISGIFSQFIGLFILSKITVDTSYTFLILPLGLIGLGIGLAIAQTTQVTLFEVPHEQSGSASGVLNTVRQVGSALGIAIVGAVLAGQISSNIRTQIDPLTVVPAVTKSAIYSQIDKNNISFSGSSQRVYIPVPKQVENNPYLLKAFQERALAIGNVVKSAINIALTQSIATSIFVGSIFVFIGIFSSFFIPNIRHKDEEKEIITAET